MIQIQLNKVEYERWLRALDKVLLVSERVIKNDMQYICAVKYAHLVVENIYNQKHMGNYAPLDEKYREWKEKHFPNKGFWRLGDDLTRNISIFKYKKGFMGGVPAGVMDSGGKSWYRGGERAAPREIALYGAASEFASVRKKQPARPIFTPSMEEFSKEEWPKQGEIALKTIAKVWS